MSDGTPSKSTNGYGEMLWGFWYPALRSDQVRGRKLERAMLLEVPLVLGRDAAGKAFALRDVCPHRAFPLSFGQFDGTSVECAYHGWQFDAHTGQCRHIPSLTADSKLKCERIYAGQLSLRGARRLHLRSMTNPEGARRERPFRAPPAPELPTFSEHYQIAHLCGRPAVQRGPRHHRIDGPGARPVRASGVVVAQPAQHSRQSQAVRADSQRISHEPARALGE